MRTVDPAPARSTVRTWTVRLSSAVSVATRPPTPSSPRDTSAGLNASQLRATVSRRGGFGVSLARACCRNVLISRRRPERPTPAVHRLSVPPRDTPDRVTPQQVKNPVVSLGQLRCQTLDLVLSRVALGAGSDQRGP